MSKEFSRAEVSMRVYDSRDIVRLEKVHIEKKKVLVYSENVGHTWKKVPHNHKEWNKMDWLFAVLKDSNAHK